MTTVTKSKIEVRPTPQQQDFIGALLDPGGGHLCLRARAGSGKCLGRGTPVMKFDGTIVPVEAIRAGDRLMGPDSRPRKVLRTSTGTGPLYRVQPVKGDSWVCNDMHVMVLQGTNRARGQVIDAPLNAHLAANPKPSRNWKLWRAAVDFSKQAVPFDPYMLGLWLGDGTRGALTLSNPDEEVIEYCRDFARKNSLCLVLRQEPGCFKISLTTGPREGLGRRRARHPLRQYIRSLAGNEVPHEFKANSREVRLAVLAGLLDTDGWFDKGGFEITTKYSQLSDDILFLARSLGLAAYKQRRAGTIKALGFKGYYWKIYISGDCSMIPTKVARKRASKRQQIKRVNVTGWSVKKLGEGMYYGFTLDGDGRFLLGDFTVTHNTSTILMGVDAYVKQNPAHEVLVCAYNKAIADEVGGKLKAAGHDWRQAQAATAHSLGFGAIKFLFKLTRDSVDDKKVRKIVDEIAAAGNAPERLRIYGGYGQQIVQLVRYAKQAGFGFFPDCAVGDTPAWHRLAYHYDVNGLEDTSEADAVVEAAQNVYRLSLADTTTIDYDDMILFPLVKNVRVKYTKDLVIVDEYQDISRARQALIRKFIGPRGRMAMVGDDRQAIYGFTGADAAALDNGVREFGARVLPLSVTWRCPRAVVALAKTLVPDLEAAPTAIEGEVLHIPAVGESAVVAGTSGALTEKVDWYTILPEKLKPTDAVLCRKTAPLVELAYKLIRAKVACKVEGRSIGDGLKAMTQRWRVKTIDAFLKRLESWSERERQKALAKGNEEKAEEVADRVQTLREICSAVLAAGKHDVADVGAHIDELFADGAKNATVLATYHRSKGREWPRVFLLGHSVNWPSKAAKQPWQRQQEDNLAYVALTRAMKSLVFVD